MANVRCPKCGAKNTEEIDTGKYECPYCGYSFTLQDLNQSLPNKCSAYDAEIKARESRSLMNAGEEAAKKDPVSPKKDSKIKTIIGSVAATILVLFVLLAWIGSQSQEEENVQTNTEAVSDASQPEQVSVLPLKEDDDFDAMGGSRTYTGNIDGKYQIVLYVEFDRFGEIAGSYYYEKSGPNNRMIIKGSNNKFDEYNQNEKYCGSFAITSGEIGKTLEINGNYTRAKDGKVLPFTLKKKSNGNSMPIIEEHSVETSIVSSESYEESEFAYLSNSVLDASDFEGKLKGELRILRNAIFAKYGYIFKSEDLQTYFAKYSWYTPRTSDVPMSTLNSNEKANIELIKSLENK